MNIINNFVNLPFEATVFERSSREDAEDLRSINKYIAPIIENSLGKIYCRRFDVNKTLLSILSLNSYTRIPTQILLSMTSIIQHVKKEKNEPVHLLANTLFLLSQAPLPKTPLMNHLSKILFVAQDMMSSLSQPRPSTYQLTGLICDLITLVFLLSPAGYTFSRIQAALQVVYCLSKMVELGETDRNDGWTPNLMALGLLYFRYQQARS